MAKIKSLFKGAKKAVEEAEKGASRRVGALGDSRVKIEEGSKVGKAVGGMKDPKTGRVLTKEKVKEVTSRGRKRIAGGAAAVGAGAALTQGGAEDKKANGKKKEKDYTKGVSQGGVPFKEAFAKARKDGKKTFEWNDKKYTTELASEKKSSSKPSSSSSSSSTKKKRGILFGKDAKFRPFGGVLARALLGEDEKFGGDRGAIDFIRPKKKNMGGMMKKKGYSKGGTVRPTTGPNRRGGVQAGSSSSSSSTLSQAQQNMLRSAQQHAANTGQNPAELQRLTAQYGDLNAAKSKDMSEAKKRMRQSGRRGGMPKMQGGGMMAKKGYAKGGAVRKKARGVGAATRGFGKAMR